tara:strand:- start:243 stop:635 length:393 start_codon:yes stop_codon:yes gene_type:complete
MEFLTAKEMFDIGVNDYFGNVDKNSIENIIKILDKDVIVKIQTHNSIHKGRDKEVSNMLSNYFDSYEYMWHGNFRPIIDQEKQTLALQFDWVLKNLDKEEKGQNLNIFKFSNKKIIEIIIFMSSYSNPLK